MISRIESSKYSGTIRPSLGKQESFFTDSNIELVHSRAACGLSSDI